MAKLFGDLQSDEASAGDDRLLNAVSLDPFINPVHVAHISQREDAGEVNSRKPRPEGNCAGGEHQVIVALLRDLPGSEVPDPNGFGVPVDCRDFMEHSHIDVERFPETLWCLYQQCVAARNLAADMVGKPAIRE